MQGLPQSHPELRVAPGRPYAEQQLQNTHRAHSHPGMPVSTLPPAAPTAPPMVYARSHGPVPGAPQYPDLPNGDYAHASPTSGQPRGMGSIPPYAMPRTGSYGVPPPHSRPKRPDSAFPASMHGALSAPSGAPRMPPMAMPRAPSEPSGLRIDVSESAPLRIGRSRPSPTTQAPPIPPGAREQISAQVRADGLHTRTPSNSSDAMAIYDHYEEPASASVPQSPTLPRTGPTQAGFLSRSVSAAQAPAAAASTPASATAPPELSIEQFESVRKHAASQPHDPRAQLELAKKLWEAGDRLANRYLDPQRPSTMEVDERTEARNREAWTAQAIKIAKPLVTKMRNPDAMFFLGSIYSTGGHGIEKDYVKALEYYHRAAQLDHTDSCYRIAVCEEFGVGTRRDFEKALSWYNKAAVLGSVASSYKLGMLALLGSVDHKRDFRAGMTWLQRAADHADTQNPHALHELGLLYEHSPLSTYQTGDPLPQNDAKALEKFYISAKLGYAPSQSRLGRAFEFGELGCNVDPNWSISWYTQAAKQRDSDAELALAGWYWTGSPGCLKKNETEAFLWAERAAGHGNTRALFAVGYFHERGVGVPKDISKARRWYTKAAEKKHHRAAERLREMVEAMS